MQVALLHSSRFVVFKQTVCFLRRFQHSGVRSAAQPVAGAAGPGGVSGSSLKDGVSSEILAVEIRERQRDSVSAGDPEQEYFV